MLDSGSLLVRVNRVRVQSEVSGVIFHAQQVNPDGEISSLEEGVTVRLHQLAAGGIPVRQGQRWLVQGKVSRKEVILPSGFKRREKTIDVPQGYAELVKPISSHITDYLSRHSDLPGIGPVSARSLWDRFGQGLYDILDAGDCQALLAVVTPEKAAMLIEVWQRENLSQTIQWLATHDIDPKVGWRLVQIHGQNSRQRVEEDCYRLLSYAAQWKEVDALGCALGMTRDDPRRLAAACEQVVYNHFSNGHTFVRKSTLDDGLRRLLTARDGLSLQIVQAARYQAEQLGRVLFDSFGNGYGIGPTLLERQVAQDIADLLRLKENSPIDVAYVIKTAEQRLGFPLNDEQRQSVALVADNRFSVITGGAGSGKTTTLKITCEVLDAQGYTIVQLALTGKAVRRMTEATCRKAQTIASFIKQQKAEHISRKQGRVAAAKPKLALLIDEASMVDLISFAAMTRAINDSCKVILVGDPHQLPPVGPGLVLHVLTTGIVPHVELKVGNRFGSEIAKVANAVRNGRPLDLVGNAAVRLIEPRTAQDLSALATSLYLTESSDSAVLCSSKALAATVNREIQQRITLNNRPVTIWNSQYDSRQDLGFRLHDPVICGRNHWDRGLQNGSIGRIIAIDMMDEDEVTGTIFWDDGVERPFDLALLADLSLAYALTVHKSQGSQWQRVIVALDRGRPLDRSLIYTGITRAQKQVTMIGQRALIERAIKEPKAADRRQVALDKWLRQTC